MKCACGKELTTSGINGICLECFNNQNKEEYARTDKLYVGWLCPKCGYVWAAWVDGCSNCNRPQYTVTTTGEGSKIELNGGQGG